MADPEAGEPGDAARIAAAWVDWNVYSVEVEEGRGEPLPEYVGAFNVAAKLGRPVDELHLVHPYWRRAAETLLEAEGLYRETMEARQQQTRH